MGYEKTRFVGVIPENYFCPICFDVLQDPQECCTCDGAFCLSCLEKCKQGSQNKCPLCNTQTKFKKLHVWIRQQINQLQIKCSNEQNGCSQVLTLEKIHKHQIECEFQKMICQVPGCRFIGFQKEILKHMEECDFRMVTCEQCETQQVQKHKKYHNCIETLKDKNKKLQQDISDLNAQYKQEIQSMKIQLIIAEEQYQKQNIQLQEQNQEFQKKNKELEQIIRSLQIQNEEMNQKLNQKQGEKLEEEEQIKQINF